MTTLLTPADIGRIVAAQGLRGAFERLAGYLEADFRRWPEFDKTPRVAAHSRDGVIELMPIADATLYSFKYVNGHPANTRRGLPTVMAFGVLADVATGTPLLLSELTLTTALRTAAMSALAARVLARPGAHVMALIGNGAQSEFQALAFHHLLGVDEIRLFDVEPAATARLMRHLAAVPGLRVTACASVAEAVCGAHIVTTVTADKARATILRPEHIEPGMHLNAVGGDCPGKTELDARILLDAAAQVFVEYEPQSRVEGEIQQLPADFAVTEFWRVLSRDPGVQAPGRRDAAAVTVFDSVGFALEDFAALRWLRDSARELGLGEPIDLIPQQADPKNLYGELGLVATPAVRAA